MKRKIKDLYPVNAIQKSMLFHSEQDRENYSVKISLDLEGTVDVKRLKAAFEQVVARHDSLRTVFPQKDYQKLVQVVFVEAPSDFAVFHNETADEAVSNAFWCEQPDFDLEKGPLVKGSLFVIDEKAARLDVLFHHIIVDGWSLDIFLRDFFSLYAGKKLSEPVQYKEYIKWQSGQSFEEGTNYYQEYLANYDNPVHLEKPTGEKSEVKSQRFKVPEQIMDCVLKKAGEIGVTSSTLFQTVWGLTITKLYNRSDFVFGNVVSGRNIPVDGIEETVGLFINTLPVRLRYQKGESALALLKRMQKFGNQALELESYPLENIIKDHPLGQDLFNTIIGVENYDLDLSHVTEGTGLEIKELTSKEQSHFPLSIAIYPGKETELLFTWQSNLFNQQLIEVFGETMIVLMEELSQGFDQQISDLQLVNQKDYLRLTEAFNDTSFQAAEADTLKKFVERIFEEARALDVLTDGVETWTYQMLENKASYIAKEIAEHRIGRNQLVAIYEERGLNLIALIFGTILAGHAFLLLNPHLPSGRLELMLADSEVAGFLALEHTEVPFSTEQWQNIKINEDTLSHTTVRYETNARSEAQDSAYVIYTSGTTGKPKGVVLKSKATANMADYLGKFVGNDCPVSIILSSLSFDMFIAELLCTIAAKGKVIITSEETRKDNHEVAQLVAAHQVSSILTTPSRLNSLLLTYPEALKKVDNFIVGGEKIEENLYEQVQQQTKARLFNAYGPSETTAYNTLMEVTKETNHYLGKPAVNSKIYILNEEKNIVPYGMAGEICIAGTPVGKGYINRQELTDSKFIKNPIDPSSKMYLTGDLGSWSKNGYLEYLGRKDDQIKIRGLRIEVQEIENTIAQIEGITSVTVFPHNNKSNQAELACVITGLEDINLIREKLSQKLPDYMIPTYIIHQESIQMTISGKFDKKYYAEMILSQNTEKQYEKPKTDVQKELFAIWAEVLGHEDFGTADHFFTAGGNSLTAMILCSKIQKHFEKPFMLHDFFNASTIKTQEAVLLRDEEQKGLVLTKGETKEAYPLTQTETRLFSIFEAVGKKSKMYNLVQGIALKNVSLDQLKEALSKIVQSNDNLRANYRYDEQGHIRKYIRENEQVEIECYTDLETEAEIAATTKAFDLESGLLYQFVAIQNKNRQLLVLNFHHIIMDGFSIEIFLNQLNTLLNGKALEKANLQFTDYALFEESLITSESYKESQKYWEEVVSDYSNQETTVGVNQEAKGQNATFVLKEGSLKKLRQTAKSLNMSLYQLTFALFSIVRCRAINVKDNFFGTISSGRSVSGSEKIMGMFANTVPVRVKLSEKKQLKEVLSEQRDAIAGAIANDLIPLNELIDKTNELNGTAVPQLFNELFILQEFGNNVGSDLENIRPLADNFNAVEPKFPMTVEAELKRDEIHFLVNYDETIYASEMIDHLMESYLTVLMTVEDQLECTVAEIEYLTEKETVQLTKFRGNVPAVTEETIQQFLAKVFADHKEQIACTTGIDSISYQELDDRSSRLASKIREKTFGKNVSIAILMERSVEIPIAAIAALKAGASFILIDKELPADRITYMLEKAGTAIVCTNSDDIALDTKAEVWNIKTFDFDKFYEPIAAVTDGDAPAYIIFTSGTTGKPKGVVNTSRGLLNSTKNIVRLAESCNQTGNVLSLTSISFDMFIIEMFMALGSGKALVLATEEERLDNDKIVDKLASHEISLLWATPSRVRMMLADERSRETLVKLGGLFLGGEALDQATADLLVSYGKVKVFNMYGPSEAAVFCSGKEVTKSNNTVTIGHPFSGNTIDIVDSSNRLLPFGSVGEIVIGGSGVGASYLSDHEKTAESFINLPYGEQSKVYKTGDLGKWTSKGEIVYIGRKDNQVKIRGYRVELQEIEAALKQLAGVLDAVVLLKSESLDHQYLTAFLVGEFEEKNVAEQLSNTLPYYFIPDFYVGIETIPMTISGKIDTKALGKIPVKTTVTSKDDMTVQEEQVAAYFRTILGKEVTSKTESFYRLGGDSIKAIQLVGKMRAEGINISVKEIIKLKSIKEIARYIDTAQQNTRHERNSFEGVSRMTSLEQQYLQMNDPDLLFNQSIVLKTNAKKREEYEQMIEALLGHHDSLRSQIRIEKNSSEHVILPMDDLRYALDERTVATALLEQEIEAISHSVQNAVKPTKGVMFSACIVHSEQSDYLFIAISHLVVDGVSWRILTEDLNRLSVLKEKGQALQLSQRSDTVNDFYNSLALAKEGQLFEEERKYWNTACSLPLEESNSSMATIQHREYIFSQNETEKLKSLLHDKQLKFDTALLSSYVEALMTLKNRAEATVFFESHGRLEECGEVDISQSVGWFTSLYPLKFVQRKNLWETARDVNLTMEKVPNLGIGFGFLAEKDGSGKLYDMYHSANKDFFNYLGEMGGEANQNQPFEMEDFYTGKEIGDVVDLSIGLSLNAVIMNQQLKLSLLYNQQLYSTEAVEDLLSMIIERIRQVSEMNEQLTEMNIKQLDSTDIDLDELDSIFDMLSDVV